MLDTDEMKVESDEGEKETGRLEAFSDGVFSIAMTLLVLELKVPTIDSNVTPGRLWAALAHQWPSYLAFITSFFTVLIMWVNHHGIFNLVRKTSGRMLFANGFLLLLVTAVPFPTALVASYLRTPAAATVCIVYAGTFVLVSQAYSLLLLAVAVDGGRLLKPGTMPEIRCRLRACFQVGLPAYGLAAAVAPLVPWLTLAICTAMWIYWSLSRKQRESGFQV